jgi:serine/threonine protein phosphatase PrpC
VVVNADLVLRCPSCGCDALADDEFCESCGLALGVLRDARRNHFEVQLESAAGVSDRGLVHRRNEDALFLECVGAATVVVVCDGVSTSVAPQVAAQIGARTAGSTITARLREGGGRNLERLVVEALAAANGAVVDVPWTPRRGSDGPSCTIVAAVWDGITITVAWSGDSRAYWVDDVAAVQLTSDHSWAQCEIDAGRIEVHAALADPRAHAITRWLGPDAPAEVPPVAVYRPVGGGRLVVCSDGLWNHLASTNELGSIVNGMQPSAPAMDVARTLTDHALTRGGSDNVTVAVVEITSPSHEPKEPTP